MKRDPVFLYVEDDPFSRKIMSMLLVQGLGNQNLTLFEDSEDFMARLYALPAVPDVIFLDIHVRPIDGFAMLDLLRADDTFCHATVVALTASVMNEEVDMLQEAGFDGCIGKPIDQDEFPVLLEQILNGEHVWNI